MDIGTDTIQVSQINCIYKFDQNHFESKINFGIVLILVIFSQLKGPQIVSQKYLLLCSLWTSGYPQLVSVCLGQHEYDQYTSYKFYHQLDALTIMTENKNNFEKICQKHIHRHCFIDTYNDGSYHSLQSAFLSESAAQWLVIQQKSLSYSIWSPNRKLSVYLPSEPLSLRYYLMPISILTCEKLI